jgi:hypothetical protein
MDNTDYLSKKRKEEQERQKANSAIVRSLYGAEPKKSSPARRSRKLSSEELKMSIARSVNLTFEGYGPVTDVYANSYFEAALRILYPESLHEIIYVPHTRKYSLKIN